MNLKLNTNSIVKHENNSEKKKRNLLFFALPVIFAGWCWFIGNIAVANRRFQLLNENDSKPGTAAIWGFDSSAFDESKYKSANTILKIRGGGSGHGSGQAGASSISVGAEKTLVAGSSSANVHPTAIGVSSANPSPRHRAPVRATQDPRATPVSKTAQNPNLTLQAEEASQNPIQRITSESVGPESILLSKSQEQSDLQAKQSSSGDSNSDLERENQEQSDLEETQSNSGYNSGYSDPDLEEEIQSNSGNSNSSSFFPTQGLQEESVIQQLKNCCCSAPDQSTLDTIPEQLVQGQEFDAPIVQMMQKRPDSATKKYIDPDAAYATLNERIQNLDHNKQVYGVICEGRVAENRLDAPVVNIQRSAEAQQNAGAFVPGREVFLRCPLGVDRNEASSQLKTIIDDVNSRKLAQNSSFQKFRHNESELEKKGLQATFSIPAKRTENHRTHCGKLDVIIWADVDSNTVKIVVLGDIQYHQRNTILGRVQRHEEAIFKSLPELAKYGTAEKWKLVEDQQFNHYIFKNDAINLGLNYEHGPTHSVPTGFNKDRPSNFDPAKTANFETSLAEDIVSEGEVLVNSFDPKNLFDQSIKDSKLPTGLGHNIRAQQESSIKFGFLESSRLLESKARPLRVNVSSFKLVEAEKKQTGVKSYEVDPDTNKFRVARISANTGGISASIGSTGKVYDIFETQKIYKGCRNCIHQVNAHLDKLQSNYRLHNKTELTGMIKELSGWYKQVKLLTRIECNLLDLNKNNPETLCAKQTLEQTADATLNRIIDAAVQVSVENGNQMNHKQIQKKVTGKVKAIEQQCEITDAASFTKNVDTARINIKGFALDQNTEHKKNSILNRSPTIRKHLSFSSRDLVDKIGNESQSLTGLIVDPNSSNSPWIM